MPGGRRRGRVRCTPSYTMTGCRTLGHCVCPPPAPARPFKNTGFILYEEQVAKLERLVRDSKHRDPSKYMSRSAIVRAAIDAYELGG